MDEYEGADEGFRGLARREAARREAEEAAERPGSGRPGRGGGWPEGEDGDSEVPGARPVPRFPIPGYGDVTARLPDLHPIAGSVDLPHWADPPTGEVPLIVPTTRAGAASPPGSGASRRAPAGDPIRAVAWRDRDADWDDLDYQTLGGADAALGALDEQRGDPGDVFSFDTMDVPAPTSAWDGGSGSSSSRGRPSGAGGEASGQSGWARDPQARAEPAAPERGGMEPPGQASQDRFALRGEPAAGALAGDPDLGRGRASRRLTLATRGRSGSGRAAGDPASAVIGDEAELDLALGDPDLGGLGAPGIPGPGGAAGSSGAGSAGALAGPGPGPGDRAASRGLVRTVTGVGIGVLLLLVLKVGPPATLALITLLVTMAAAELYGVLRRAGYKPATLLGLVATVCLMVAVYLKGEAAIGVVVAITMAASLLWYLLGVERVRPTANLAATVLGFLWVGLLGSYAALLVSPALFPDRHGEAFFLGAVIATVSYDVGALVVGARSGRHPLAPSASPNKTWEGMIGGIVLCLLVTALVVGRIHPWDTADALGLALVVCVVAPLGDLCESVVKRDLGIKDMGSILPGHGGILDRLDALLFVVPATFYLVRVLHIGVG